MPGFSERILWIFGLPGSGKTTAAAALRDYLQVEGWTALMLDEKTLNASFTPRLEASEADPFSMVRHAAEVAKTLADQGAIVIVTMTTRLEQQRQLAREILGDNLFLVQLNCSRALREQRTLSREPLPADDSFEPPASGAHMISTDQISVLQTAQLILKLLRLRQEHPASSGATMDKPVLRRIFPRDQAEQKLPTSSGAMDQRPAGHSGVAAMAERTPSVDSGLNISPGIGGGQFRSPAQRDDQSQSQPTPPPREAPSRAWRGTMETDATSEPESAGAEGSVGGQGSGRSGRHRPRRFVENQDLVWSPLSLIILTICTGIGIAVFVWIIDSSLKKKAEKERLMEGNVLSVEAKPKPYETTPPSDALTKKRNANGR